MNRSSWNETTSDGRWVRERIDRLISYIASFCSNKNIIKIIVDPFMYNTLSITMEYDKSMFGSTELNLNEYPFAGIIRKIINEKKIDIWVYCDVYMECTYNKCTSSHIIYLSNSEKITLNGVREYVFHEIDVELLT